MVFCLFNVESELRTFGRTFGTSASLGYGSAFEIRMLVFEIPVDFHLGLGTQIYWKVSRELQVIFMIGCLSLESPSGTELGLT